MENINLQNFVKEVTRVSDWYQTFSEEGEKVQGPGSIIGMKFWDGGDDIDYINSGILGFEEYGEVFSNGKEYLRYFQERGYLTKDSSEKWKKEITALSELFDLLSEQDRKDLWKSFPEYFDEDPAEDSAEESAMEGTVKERFLWEDDGKKWFDLTVNHTLLYVESESNPDYDKFHPDGFTLRISDFRIGKPIRVGGQRDHRFVQGGEPSWDIEVVINKVLSGDGKSEGDMVEAEEFHRGIHKKGIFICKGLASYMEGRKPKTVTAKGLMTLAECYRQSPSNTQYAVFDLSKKTLLGFTTDEKTAKDFVLGRKNLSAYQVEHDGEDGGIMFNLVTNKEDYKDWMEELFYEEVHNIEDLLTSIFEPAEEMYGFEAISRTDMEDLTKALSSALKTLGSVGVIQFLINEDLGVDFEDQITFIKNTTDLSDSNKVLNEIIQAAETLLDDVQIELLVQSLGESDNEAMDEVFDDGEEYEEPEDWSSVDEVEPIEEESEG